MYVSTSSAVMDLIRAKEVSLEVILIGYYRRKTILGCKIVFISEWIMRQDKSFQTIVLHSYQFKMHQMVDSRQY